MYNIIIVFFILVLFSFSEKELLRHISFLLLAYLFSTRTIEIFDTDIYLRDFENPYLEWVQSSREPLFWFLNVFFGQILSISFSQFLFVLTFVFIELWYKVTIMIVPGEGMGWCLLLFMSYNGFFYFGVVLRNLTALIFCLMAFGFLIIKTGFRRYIYFYIILFIASLFHRSVYIFFFIPVIAHFIFNQKKFAIWLVSDVILAIIGTGVIAIFGSSMVGVGGLEKYEDSLTDVDTGKSLLSIWFVMNFVICSFLVISRRRVDKVYMRIYDLFLSVCMIGLTINCMGGQMGIVQRLAGAFYFFNFIPLYLLLFKSESFLNKRKQRIAIVSTSAFCFIVLCYCQSYLMYY